jgi:hypothetical protein
MTGSEMMDDVEQLAAERACEALITAYTHHVDDFRERARVHELFTVDGIWESDEARLEGRDQITTFFSKDGGPRKSRHISSNVAVDVTGPDSAEGLSYFTLYRHLGEKPRVPDLDNQPVILGHYTDRFQRTSDGWRIAHRRADVGFVRRSALKG